MIQKLIDLVTLGPLKGSRSKFGALAAVVAILLEHFGVLAPGSLTQHKEIWLLAEGYFVIEHFEKKG